ncbi:MAG: helicase-exonuclease AddAB subunit AddA [Anaerovoracaceae bacterium]|jgi:ATP-dependent helicase/nuclease subunit A
MKWTDRQERAITEKGHDLLVSAAAGSGKTTVLIERIRRLIIDEGVDVDRLLVVTFTKAAADEMKEKLIRALQKGIVQDPQHAARMKAQLDNIYRASISTFHAFALNIVKRYFYLIDIDPGISICDDAESVIMKNDSMDLVFEEMFQAGDEAFIDFLDKYSDSRSEDALKAELLKLYEKLRSMPDPFGWLKSAIEDLDTDREEFLRGPVMEVISNDIRELMHKAIEAYTKAKMLLDDQDLTRMSELVGMELNQLTAVRDKGFDETGAACRDFESCTLRAKDYERPSYNLIKDDVKAWRAKGKEIVDDLNARYFARTLDEHLENIRMTRPAAEKLCDILEKFDGAYREAKDERGLVDFSDIEHYAIRILDDDSAAAELRDKYEHIFIDEYQDSNYLQEAIISKVQRGDNVFMVGDLKQSIYRFRLAEPDIFREKARTRARVDLNMNYRSKKPVIDAVNIVFGEIMDDYDDDAALHAGLTEDGGLNEPMQLICVDGSKSDDDDIDQELSDMKTLQLEAMTAVKAINSVLGTDIYDNATGSVRKVMKKDIVILMRGAKRNADVFFEALQMNGIEAYVDDNTGYFDTLEILTFTDLLRVIDNSRQDIPLLSVLRSQIFGFDIDELIRIRMAHGEGTFRDSLDYYAESGSEPELRQKAGGVLEKLSRWKQYSAGVDLDVFVWKLMRETGYYSYIGALPGGRQRQANLRALVDKVADFRGNKEATIYSLLRYIDAIGSNKIDMGQVKLVSDNDDVVRIMTIHKSKGLEFPVVLVCGLGKRFNFDKPSKLGIMQKDLGLGMAAVSKSGHWRAETLIEEAIDLREKKESLDEEVRILYVAMTRAKDRLILIGGMRDLWKRLDKYDIGISQKSCYLDMIYNAVRKAGLPITFEDRTTLSEYAMERERHGGEVRELLDRAAEIEVPEEISQRLSFVYPYAEDEKIKSKYSVSEINSGSNRDFSLRRPAFTLEEKKFSAAERGTIYHTVMEHLDFARAAAEGEGYISGLIEQLVDKEILYREEADIVETERIERFFETGVGIRAAAAEKVNKESHFNMLYDHNGREVIVQGVIDCWFEDADGLVLLDYKTNESVSGIEAKYRDQIDIYARALETVTGHEVGEAYLYLFSEDRPVAMI